MRKKWVWLFQKRVLSVLLALGVLGFGLLAFYWVRSSRLALGKPVCAICKRPLHPAQMFIAVSKEGREYRACCPRCGLRFVIENNATPSKAGDFSTGTLIDAETAHYLEGSDLMQCCTTTPLRSDAGLICEVHYDRCLPSLVAFSKAEDAGKYRDEHGGRVMDLMPAKRSVAQQLGK
jgi:hypothetical protein